MVPGLLWDQAEVKEWFSESPIRILFPKHPQSTMRFYFHDVVHLCGLKSLCAVEP